MCIAYCRRISHPHTLSRRPPHSLNPLPHNLQILRHRPATHPHTAYKPSPDINRDPATKNNQPPIRTLNPIERRPRLLEKENVSLIFTYSLRIRVSYHRSVQIRRAQPIKQYRRPRFALRDINRPQESVVHTVESD